MDISITLLYAVIFAFLIAFVFSMFGQGGGSVYSPLLILLGYAVLLSTSTSLVLNLITSLSAGYIFYRNKMIDFRASFLFVPGIVVGAFAGGFPGCFGSEDGLYLLGKGKGRGKAQKPVPCYARVHRAFQSWRGINLRAARSRRRYIDSSFHDLRLQVSSKNGSRVVAFDYILLSTCRNNRTCDISPSRYSIDCGDWYCRSHWWKSRGENQHESQI